MEEQMKKDWSIIKGIFTKFETRNINRRPYTYLTKEEIEEFERKMKNSIRIKKLQRVLSK